MIKARLVGAIMDSKKIVLATHDRRSGQRVMVTISAVGLMRGNDKACECTILDISESGARIDFGPVEIPPSRFKMLVHDTNELYDCETVRQAGTSVGVRFLNVVDLSAED